MIRGKFRACLMLAVVAVAVLPALAAPPWFARSWQSDAGLPDNTVMGTVQTPDGFLWVATQTGLVRFDGVQFRQFPLADGGAPAGIVKTLAADRRGRLWVAVGGRKVVCVDPGHPTTTFQLEKGEAEKGTAMMVVDGKEAVWVTYSNGEVFRLQEGKARLFTVEDGLSEGRECRLTLDVAGRLWFLRGEWVGVFRDGKFHALEQLGPQRIAAARSGGIWVWGRRKSLEILRGRLAGAGRESAARAGQCESHDAV